MSPDGGGKGSARREPAGDKNFARSKPPRAGPEETEQSKKERTAPPRLPPGGAPTRAGRLAGPRLLLLFLFLVPGRVPRSEEPGEAVPGGAAPPAAAGHVPPSGRAVRGPRRDGGRSAGGRSPGLPCAAGVGTGASAAPPAWPARALPVRLLLPPATGAARPPGGASDRHRPAARSQQVRVEQPVDAGLLLPAQATPARSPLSFENSYCKCGVSSPMLVVLKEGHQ